MVTDLRKNSDKMVIQKFDKSDKYIENIISSWITLQPATTTMQNLDK